MNSETLSISLNSEWFLPTFIVGWLAITGLLALMSGWVSLARTFRASGPISGKTFRFASGSMGNKFMPVRYGNCFFITTNDQGLYLSILFPFRFLSPPLFLPWSCFASVERRRFLFIPYYILTIKEQWARIGLGMWAGRSAKEAYDSARGTMAL